MEIPGQGSDAGTEGAGGRVYASGPRHSITYLDAGEGWMLETDRWDPDHARVAAINHFVKRCKERAARAEPPLELLSGDTLTSRDQG
jgi:hypothetical protein